MFLAIPELYGIRGRFGLRCDYQGYLFSEKRQHTLRSLGESASDRRDCAIPIGQDRLLGLANSCIPLAKNRHTTLQEIRQVHSSQTYWEDSHQAASARYNFYSQMPLVAADGSGKSH